MSEDKDNDKAGSWFPNLNYLLLILLAGTLFVTQSPFHQFRPDKPEATKPPVRLVDARPWQDPFEAVEKYIEKNQTAIESAGNNFGLETIQAGIKSKVDTNQLDKAHIVAVMLPGDPYFEDSETRRKLRYAVLSGFAAALRYVPENSSHIQFFQIDQQDAKNESVKNYEPDFEHRVAYEWMVYKPVDYNEPPNESERRYQRPPVLVLYLNNDEFTITPHKKLKDLIKNIQTPPRSTPNVHILGPFDSDNLQDLVNEMFGRSPEPDDEQFEYYSPSATLQDSNLLKNNCPQFISGCSVWPEVMYSNSRNLLASQADEQSKNSLKKKERPSCADEANLYMAYYNQSYLNQYLLKKQNQADKLGALYLQKDFGNYVNNFLAYCCLDAPYPQFMGMQLRFFKPVDLHDYFDEHGISFLRVTPTDEDLAIAIKKELKIRGIEPDTKNRVLLLGEWDTLYGWHLPNTFAAELLKNNKGNCKKTEQNKPEDELQNWDAIYEAKDQCIFRFSYLRGLDGEKKQIKDSSNKSSNNSKDGITKGQPETLEEADGDSQFDYVRRLALQVAELDKEIRKDNVSAHPIKAIGVLGSDVYDKLLILEALHEKFPDAVFFTNNMDARFLQPEHNQWARNLIVASGFGLNLDRHLQRDIPPFRDSTQTAFFLATQMALAKSFDILDERAKKLSSITQTELDDLTNNHPRVFELGRSKSFDLIETRNCSKDGLCIHPEPLKSSWNMSFPGIIIVLVAILLGLLFPPAARRFLQNETGFWFIFLVVAICSLISLYISAIASNSQPSWSIPQDGYGAFVYFIIGLLYSLPLVRIASIEDQQTAQSRLENYLPGNIVLILLGVLILLIFVKPEVSPGIQEQFALLEGVSMWPSEVIRLLALIITGYFIIDVLGFPKKFTSWMAAHFQLRGLSKAQIASEWEETQFSTHHGHHYLLLNEWLDWKNAEIRWLWKNPRKRWLMPLLYASLFFAFGSCVFLFFGSTQIPFRGESMMQLDSLLIRGLLVPAFIFLLFLVVDIAMKATALVEQCFPDKLDGEDVKWPAETLQKYANLFNIGHMDDIQEWVGMRFIVELNSQVYAIIGYPLIITLLMVLARSSYFDNWNVPVALKLVIGSSLVLLIYWDYRLKKAADKSRNIALKSLRQKAIKYNGEDTGEKLERLIAMIENYNEGVYKSFNQRPIFFNSLLIVIALLADSVDYSLLASKLL